MHFVHGLEDGNARKARRIYQERFPNRVLPSAPRFTSIHRRLAGTGSFKRAADIIGKPRAVRTPELEEAVLNALEENPETSTRIIAEALNSIQSTVWRIIHDQQFYPYHIQRVQALLPLDFHQRITMCQWFLRKVAGNPQFLRYVLFTDEANFHNNHVWALENTHSISEIHLQYQFSVNLWAAIINNYLIGLCMMGLRPILAL
ncbi:hypothetical protein JTB14_026584 [Gonioctena quinquepunctata]|nr:hypothetical protein JTB14_026584 [Gonioctena quinquepunctata]